MYFHVYFYIGKASDSHATLLRVSERLVALIHETEKNYFKKQSFLHFKSVNKNVLLMNRFLSSV